MFWIFKSAMEKRLEKEIKIMKDHLDTVIKYKSYSAEARYKEVLQSLMYVKTGKRYWKEFK